MRTLNTLAAQDGTDDLETYYLENLHALDLKPRIISLEPGKTGSDSPEETELALASVPIQQKPIPAKPRPEAVELSSEDSVARFCFVIHPLSMRHMERLPAVRAVRRMVPARLIEDAAAQSGPLLVGSLRNVTSLAGARAEGLIYAIPMTSRAIMRFPPEFMYKRLLRVAELAQRQGCRLMGLGAYTSVAGDAGMTVSQRSPIGVTSGNSYTVSATLRTLLLAARRCGIRPADSTALVIGATGSIGSVCSRLLASQVRVLCLVSPRPEKLLQLARRIEEENPQLAGRVRLARTPAQFIREASLVVTTTSAVESVIDVSELRPGAVVCDVARPPDINEAQARRRRDILVVESGEILLPQGSKLTVDIGLPRGVIYACLAETLLLALDGRFGHYTLGREIDPDKVREIEQVGFKHGFELAPIRSFGKAVPEAHFARLRKVNEG